MPEQREEVKKTWYDLAWEKLPDKRFVFMNHGYASTTDHDDFDWLLPGDEHQKYSVNLVRHLVGTLELTGKTIVDIGCGRGGSVSYFNRYCKAEHITGVDLSKGNIDFCQETHSDNNLTFLQASAECIPIESGAIDFVFNLESSHLYPDVTSFLNEVIRILDDGGTFCYCDIFQPFRVPLWRQLLSRVGFNIVREFDLTQNVAQAIRNGKQEQRAFFDDLISAHPDSAELLNPLHSTISNRMLKKYSTGTWRYHAWHLQK